MGHFLRVKNLGPSWTFRNGVKKGAFLFQGIVLEFVSRNRFFGAFFLKKVEIPDPRDFDLLFSLFL